MRRLTRQEADLMYAGGLAGGGILFIFGGWVVVGFTLSVWAFCMLVLAWVPKGVPA